MRIAKSVPKGKPGAVGQVDIRRYIEEVGVALCRPAGGKVVVIDGDLAFGAGKADGQLAGRIVIAKEDIRHGVAGAGTQPPRIKDRGNVIGRPVKDERSPGAD